MDTPAEAGWLHNLIAVVYGSVFWVIATLGLPPSFVVLLQTRGRRSGKLRTTILLTANDDGERYLASVTGAEAQWVRNAQAANGAVRRCSPYRGLCSSAWAGPARLRGSAILEFLRNPTSQTTKRI